MSLTPTPTSPDSVRPQRGIAWGTTIAGTIAVGIAVLIGLTEIAGLSIPFSTAGPGAVIVVGLLILLAGVAVVIRSGRSAASAPQPTVAQLSAPQVSAPPPTTPLAGSATHTAAEDAGPPPARPVTAAEDGPAQSSH